MKRFWNWTGEEGGDRVLRLEGPIDAESFWGDGVTPQAFRDELEAGAGDVTVWINSEGGNVFAAAEIYTMLRDYPGTVTVKIASVAASAASVVAMAGDRVLMSPTAMLFLHDPSTIAMGNARDMEKAIDTLNAVKDSIINAYRAKTGLSRNRLSKIMENESWIHAEDALKLGFCDGILFDNRGEPAGNEEDADGKGAQEAAVGPQGGGNGEDGETDGRAPKKPQDGGYGAPRIFSTKMMARAVMNHLGSLGVFHEAGNESGTPDADPDCGEADSGGKEESAGEETGKGRENGGDSGGFDAAAPADGMGGAEPAEGIGSDAAAPVPAGGPNATDRIPDTRPVIGMDGKTEDGAMPYEILKNQLDFLR